MAAFLSDFLPDSDASSKLQLVDEGLDKLSSEEESSPYKLIEEADIRAILIPRKSFSHKGTYGHALIIAGDVKTMGAALLCASGCYIWRCWFNYRVCSRKRTNCFKCLTARSDVSGQEPSHKGKIIKEI